MSALSDICVTVPTCHRTGMRRTPDCEPVSEAADLKNIVIVCVSNTNRLSAVRNDCKRREVPSDRIWRTSHFKTYRLVR